MTSERAPAASDMFPVPLATLRPGTLAPVDLYMRVSQPVERFTLYKAAQTPMREETRHRLMAHNVESLYLRTSDRDDYYDYVEEHVKDIIRDDLLPPRKACEIVYDTSARVMQRVFDDPRSGKSMKRGRHMVEATVMAVLKDPNAAWHLLDIASHDYYTYTHCVNVAVFMIAAGKDLLGIEDERTLQELGLGGVFHDIGKSQIPDEILSKPGRLTPEEFGTIKKHPVLGEDIVRTDRKAGRLTQQIVRGHHEHCDGSGYPDGLADRSITKVLRLATIADVYDAMTTNRPYARARSPFEALRIMTNDMAPQFDMGMLRSFIKFLGPADIRARLKDQADEMARELTASAAGA